MIKALVTGVTGMAGSHMVDLLLREDMYEVYGLIRPRSDLNPPIISRITNPKYTTVVCDLTDTKNVEHIINTIRPDIVFNFAAQSYVGDSWNAADTTLRTNILSVNNLLSAIHKSASYIKFYQASTAEMYGDLEGPHNEESPFRPNNIYGVSKLAAHNLVNTYRQSYNLYAVSGITFAHESERRGLQFVSRKITSGLARIYATNDNTPIKLGWLGAVRDYAHASDYMKAILLIMQQPVPTDYVIGTGVPHTPLDIVKVGCEYLDLDVDKVIKFDDAFVRPTESASLYADPSRLMSIGWKPSLSFEQLVRTMVQHDLDLLGGK